MSQESSFLERIRSLFSLKWKIGRWKFALILISSFLIYWSIAVAIALVARQMKADEYTLSLLFLLFVLFWVWMWISIVAIIKRFRDLGESGWNALFLLVPIANLFFVFNLFFIKGEEKEINTMWSLSKPNTEQKETVTTGKISSKLTLPIAIILGAALIWGSYYAAEINKQSSIERQQAASVALTKEKMNREAQENRAEHTSKRKKECYEIYEKESKKWSNAYDYWYNESKDECVVNYHGPDWKEGDNYFDAMSESGVVDENKFFDKRF